MKIVYDKLNLQDLTTKEVMEYYKAFKQARLKLAYEVNHRLGEELDRIKSELIGRQKQLKDMEEQARIDRESCNDCGGNDSTLNLH